MVRARTVILPSLVVTFFMLMGCDLRPAGVQQCEARLLHGLKAPSSYKLVDATVSHPKPDGSRDIWLQYDAANAYNAPIRGLYQCSLDKAGELKVVYGGMGPEQMTDGRASELRYGSGPSLDEVADDLVRKADDEARNIVRAREESAETPRDEPDAEQVPVCDRPESPEKRKLMEQIGTTCMGE